MSGQQYSLPDPAEYEPPEPTTLAVLDALLGDYHDAGHTEGSQERLNELAHEIVGVVEVLLPQVENLRVAASYLSHRWEHNLTMAANQLSSTLANFEEPFGVLVSSPEVPEIDPAIKQVATELGLSHRDAGRIFGAHGAVEQLPEHRRRLSERLHRAADFLALDQTPGLMQHQDSAGEAEGRRAHPWD